jgi:hypothetical protein
LIDFNDLNDPKNELINNGLIKLQVLVKVIDVVREIVRDKE